MTDFLSKFQQLLRELFQFDVADLDFGIYQIMNHKRREVERFITEDLPQRVTEALAQGALAEGAQASQELQEVAAQIRQMLGAEALDAAGELAAAYHAIPLGKKYLELKAKAAGARSRDALEALVYNHLFAFFSHYYQDGDFISKRRYSTRQERYAIPYNGEEVTLYWANHDQYYVKTAEYFSDYTFTAANGVTVHFKLRAADVEQNNVKGEKRFFVPQPAETSWDAAAAQLVIPFEFRPLTAQESITYGGKNQQDAILTRALTDIPKRLSAVTAARALAALNEEKRRTADGEPVTALAHHLRQYTRRNTSDFFIHKDLRGFLARELDFYLKNEVLSLDEMEAAGEGRAEGWFELLRAVRAVGSRIIEFLAQVEEFQKMLWEKRKFITETFYCITVGNIPDAFYGEIAACDAEWAEWGVLFDVDAALTQRREDAERMEFLRTHPTLVVDTRHFDQPFVDRLLGSFDDLDEMTDGVLVHSENWQALRLLDERCREQVKCIYIDPPYNTGSDGFPYKDTYQHSTWLAMMQDRVLLLHALLHQNGRFFCSIDDRENDVLLRLLRGIFSAGSYLGTITWEKRTKSQNTVTARRMLQSKVEYIHPFAKRDLRQEFNLESTGQKEYPLVDKKGIYRLQRVEEMSAEGGRGRQTMIFSILGINPRPGKQWQLGEQYINNKLVADEVVLLDGIPHVMVRPEEEEQETFRPFWSHFFDKDAYGTAESGLELLDKALAACRRGITYRLVATNWHDN